MAEQHSLTHQQVTDTVISLFRDRMPFNQLLGIGIIQEHGRLRIELPWQDQLTGNPLHKILHGGVTSSLLDTIGGLVAIVHAIEQTEPQDLEQMAARLANFGTVDMRVDYLRPGRGKTFIATAEVIRKGNRVVVCRMELHNERGDHIAFGTGTYMLS